MTLNKHTVLLGNAKVLLLDEKQATEGFEDVSVSGEILFTEKLTLCVQCCTIVKSSKTFQIRENSLTSPVSI